MIEVADQGAAMQGRKLAGLDVLRGIAILMVIVAHFLSPSLTIQLALGNGGVILFFFLSGFLMDRNLAIDPAVGRYAIRRAFRILPTYWLSIVLIVLTSSNWTMPQIASNATFTAPLFGFERMSGVYWTLYIEVTFYMIAPLLRMMGERAIRLAPFVFIAALGVMWATRGGVNAALFYMVFCFAGMQFGAWYRGALSLKSTIFSMAVIAVASAAFPVVSVWLGLAPIVFGPMLWLALTKDIHFKPLEYCGNISYSWYLTHFIVGVPILHLGAQLGMGRWLPCIIATAASFLLSALIWRYFEKPTIEIGRRVVKRWQSTPIASAAVN
jgi:peptidoglycan/LPS O-acetylase OafA/YrhL